MRARHRVAKTSDLTAGKGCLVKAGGRAIALFNVDGRFYAIDNACAHLGGPLSEGVLLGCTVVCPWHNWEYDVTTGKEVLLGEEAVRSYPVEVEGEEIYIVTEETAATAGATALQP